LQTIFVNLQLHFFGNEKKFSNPACLVSDLQAKIDAQLYLDFSEENTPTFVIEY
jgi:hypothetical protein